MADGLRTGKLDAASFAPAGRAEAVAALKEWGPLLAGAWSAPERWTLIREERPPGKWMRSYRAQHGGLPVRWTFTLDEKGLVLDVDANAD